MTRSRLFAIAAIGLLACVRSDVDVELPKSGRALTDVEQRELRSIAEATFRAVKPKLEGLPPRLTLIVSWGHDVVPETGEGATAAFPGNVGLTLDPDRDALVTIRAQVRPALVHELHHLARASRVATRTLLDRVVSEGLATAFERDVAKVDPPWGKAPPEIADWVHEVLRQPDGADQESWLIRLPDGRRWVGMRVGTYLVDRACRNSGKTAADHVFTPTAEIVRLSGVQP